MYARRRYASSLFLGTIRYCDSPGFLRFFTWVKNQQTAARGNNNKSLGPQPSGHAVSYGVSGDYGTRGEKKVDFGGSANTYTSGPAPHLLRDVLPCICLARFAGFLSMNKRRCPCVRASAYVGTPGRHNGPLSPRMAAVPTSTFPTGCAWVCGAVRLRRDY